MKIKNNDITATFQAATFLDLSVAKKRAKYNHIAIAILIG